VIAAFEHRIYLARHDVISVNFVWNRGHANPPKNQAQFRSF